MFGILPPIQDRRELNEDSNIKSNKKKNINFPKPLKILNIILPLACLILVIFFFIKD